MTTGPDMTRIMTMTKAMMITPGLFWVTMTDQMYRSKPRCGWVSFLLLVHKDTYILFVLVLFAVLSASHRFYSILMN